MERIKKEIKERVMNVVNKVNDAENYETTWNEKGLPESKNKINIKRGGLSRARGARFELKVRDDLKLQGWIVNKWMNNVDLEKNEIISAKRKYNPFFKAMTIGTGFPDFICFKKSNEKQEVRGIEAKSQGYLDKEERKKVEWYLKNKIFSKILVAKKAKKAGQIEYINFGEKYGIK